MKLKTQLILAAFAVSIAAPLSVMAANQESKNQGYLVAAPDSAIVTSGYGLCWHSSAWESSQKYENCDPSNKPVAVAPAPIVVAALPAAKPVPQKISFSGDALFAFDKAELKPEGKVMLDDLANQLNGATYDNIIATGHTDRFGSNQYNQNLSERRAETVKNYLIGKNVQAARIDTAGKGETQPVTLADACQGAKSAKVLACLQPDRRVDVEMIGTKSVAAL
ncbi:OmpA family protein [Oxalobacteraceae bacterium R-40]|uniref:OmpA family protein n=1 Tax=Keguizhuia sedimenti TaxID=3064264 RepID=A0ABU1BMX5_9BURK|nr:OmpA family protein [Oxalobacteraceae bacterium R-40]